MKRRKKKWNTNSRRNEIKIKIQIEIHKHLADFRFYDRNECAINNSFVTETSPQVYNMRSNTVHARKHHREPYAWYIHGIDYYYYYYCDDDDNDHNNINDD